MPLICDITAGTADWSRLLSEIGRWLRADAACLLVHDFASNQGRIQEASNCKEEYVRSYSLHYARQNIWLARERAYQTPGRVCTGEDAVSESDLIGSAFFSGWLRPQGLHHRLCAVLSREERAVVLLEIFRRREAGRFDAGDAEQVRMVLPHLQRALRSQQRLTELERERDAAVHALDHLPWGVVLVNERGHRLAANRRAQEILLAGDGLLIQGATLGAAQSDESVRLSRLLTKTLRQELAGGILSITRPSGAHPLNVQIIPLRAKNELAGDRVAAAAIFVSDPSLPLASNQQHLRDLYALTAVEARLAVGLAQGKSVEMAASEMGISVNTARSYVKRIYNKTGVRRQSELVRLMLVGLTQLRQPEG